MLLIVLAQGIRFLLISSPPKDPEFVLQEHPSVLSWLDSLQNSKVGDLTIYSYNPNFLSDYQAYMLGISPEEIDRLFAYRAAGNWINSEEDFWAVTEIEEDRKSKIRSRLRFKNVRKETLTPNPKKIKEANPLRADINKVSAPDLTKIRGIGPVLSERIIKFRNSLGGYQIKEQLFDVYGLDSIVVHRLFQHFDVIEKPDYKLININEASAEKIASLVYLRKAVAYRIVRYRELHGPFENLDQLTKIEDFPSDKIDRIRLYLSL